MDQNYFETQAIRTQSPNGQFREHSTPVYMTSSFTFENAEHARALFNDEAEGNIYTRFSNPNNNEFIDKLCLLENAEDGISTASGMAAMFSSMAALLKAGDHILASRSVFGSTHQLFTKVFPKWGITHSYADINNPAEWESKIQTNTKMIFAETPSNPALDILDLEWLGGFARKHSLILNIDNCFATPYLQQPIKWGADIVTHSATKFIDGQGRAIGGAIVGRKDLIKEIRFFARHSGPALSPFNGWILSKSLETLAVRMDKHCENALKLAQHLESHPEIASVKYPFLPSHQNYEIAKKQMKLGGGIVTFVVEGGLERGRKFLNSLQMLSLTANLGDSRTTVTHSASTTHSKLSEAEQKEVGILPGLIRVSVGLENINDIISDIDLALEKTKTLVEQAI